jgi:hypothetical protein
MIRHASLPAREPLRVARFLAKALDARAYPFPGPLPGAYLVLPGDALGTELEIYPDTTHLLPGEGEAPVRYLAGAAMTGPLGVHLLLAVPRGQAELEALARREGWRTQLAARGAPGQPAVFRVLECWLENRFLLELVPPDLLADYEAAMQPAVVGAVVPALPGD